MNNEYLTKDLHLAAFLYVQEVKLLRLEKHQSVMDDRDPLYFVFEDKELCLLLEGVFWDGKGKHAKINVKEYVATIRDLRARLSAFNQAPHL